MRAKDLVKFLVHDNLSQQQPSESTSHKEFGDKLRDVPLPAKPVSELPRRCVTFVSPENSINSPDKQNSAHIVVIPPLASCDSKVYLKWEHVTRKSDWDNDLLGLAELFHKSKSTLHFFFFFLMGTVPKNIYLDDLPTFSHPEEVVCQSARLQVIYCSRYRDKWWLTLNGCIKDIYSSSPTAKKKTKN